MWQYKSRNKKLGLKQFIKDFSLFIKQCYCIFWSVEKNTESKNPKVITTKNGRIMLSSKCEVCGSKKPKFIKDQEAGGLLSSLGIETLLSKIPLVVPLLF